jgi:hypothetical protein
MTTSLELDRDMLHAERIYAEWYDTFLQEFEGGEQWPNTMMAADMSSSAGIPQPVLSETPDLAMPPLPG